MSPNHTYGSIELINGASFNTEKYNEDDMREEITELRKQVKNLNDDRYGLIKQLNQSEDVNAQLQSTNQACESRIQSLKLSLDNALSFRSSEPEEACLHDDKGQETAIRRINQLGMIRIIYIFCIFEFSKYHESKFFLTKAPCVFT